MHLHAAGCRLHGKVSAAEAGAGGRARGLALVCEGRPARAPCPVGASQSSLQGGGWCSRSPKTQYNWVTVRRQERTHCCCGSEDRHGEHQLPLPCPFSFPPSQPVFRLLCPAQAGRCRAYGSGLGQGTCVLFFFLPGLAAARGQFTVKSTKGGRESCLS